MLLCTIAAVHAKLMMGELMLRLLRMLMSYGNNIHTGDPEMYPGCPLTTICRQKSALPSV